jgi:hypothetical protein
MVVRSLDEITGNSAPIAPIEAIDGLPVFETRSK